MLARNVSEIRKSIRSYEQAWAKEAQKALRGELPLWVALGDSMSQGIGASEFNKGWVGQALDILHHNKKNYSVVNLSKNGARIEDVLHDQLLLLEELGREPAVITLLIGSNDLMAPKSRLKLASNLERLLNHLPEGTIVGDIFCRPSTPMPFRTIFTHSAASDLLHKIASQRKFIVVPLDKAFSTPWRGKIAADYYHPNDRGYEGIARAFAKAIQKNG